MSPALLVLLSAHCVFLLAEAPPALAMENSHQVRLSFALRWVFCLVGLPRWNLGLPPALNMFLELWRLVAAYQVLFRKRRGGFGAPKHISHHKGRAPLKLEVEAPF